MTGFSIPRALFVFQSSLLRSIAFLFRLEFFSTEAEMKFGSRGSPDGESLLKLELWAEPGSRRSPGIVLSELMLRAEPGTRRSLGGAFLGVVDRARLP